MQTQLAVMFLSETGALPNAVTDGEGRLLDDDDGSGLSLCTYWCRIFGSRTENGRHLEFLSKKKSPEHIQWSLDKQEFDEMIAKEKESAAGS